MESPKAEHEARRSEEGEDNHHRTGDQSLSGGGLHHPENPEHQERAGGTGDSSAELRSGCEPVEPEWAALRRHWYSQTYILLEIAKLLNSKEMCYIEKDAPPHRQPKVMRCGQGFTVDLLKSHFDAFRFFDFSGYNMYYSLMNFKTPMPTFSFAPPERKEQYAKWTDGGYKEYFKSYDWGVDFDSKSIPEAHQDAQKLKILFDQYRLPYSLKFSGSKGFHFRVVAHWLPELPLDKIVPMLNELTYKIKMIDNIPHIDSSIIDDRRVFKIDYSFDRGKICLPLTDEQFEHFDLKMVEPAQVLHSVQIKNRGVLERFSSLSQEQAVANFWKLAKNFINVSRYIDTPKKMKGVKK